MREKFSFLDPSHDAWVEPATDFVQPDTPRNTLEKLAAASALYGTELPADGRLSHIPRSRSLSEASAIGNLQKQLPLIQGDRGGHINGFEDLFVGSDDRVWSQASVTY